MCRVQVATRMHNVIARYYVIFIVILHVYADQQFCYTSQEALLKVYYDQ